MRASEYFKMLGHESAKYEVENQSTALCHIFGTDFFDDLKRLVESWDLVESLGGLDEAKEEYQARIQNNEPTCGLAKTIEDVESCQ